MMTRKQTREDKECDHLTTRIRKVYVDGVLRFLNCAYCGEITKTYAPNEKKLRGD